MSLRREASERRQAASLAKKVLDQSRRQTSWARRACLVALVGALVGLVESRFSDAPASLVTDDFGITSMRIVTDDRLAVRGSACTKPGQRLVIEIRSSDGDQRRVQLRDGERTPSARGHAAESGRDCTFNSVVRIRPGEEELVLLLLEDGRVVRTGAPSPLPFDDGSSPPPSGVIPRPESEGVADTA